MSSFSIPRDGTPYRSRLGWLPISIALNLLLIGLVLAWVFNMSAAPRRQPLVTWQQELISSLSAADAAVASNAVAQIADSQVACDAEVHAQYAKIRALLAIEPVDSAAISADFDQIIAARDAQQVTALRAFDAELKAVSPEGRKKFLAAMEKESQRAHTAPGR